MALGVGVALARAGRERIGQRRRRLDRELALAAGEPLAEGIRRVALGQLDLTVELLEGHEGMLDEHAVHEIRKALKRLRALLRLVRDELGEQTFRRENETLRDAGRRLSAARDSEVMLATLDALTGGGPRKLRRRRGLAELRRALEAEHARMEDATLGDGAMRGQVLSELVSLQGRVEEWALRERGAELAEPGLERVYRQGRRRFRAAARSRGRDASAMHQWRKRVKDLRHQAEILHRREGPALAVLATRGRRRARGRRKQIERARRRLGRVAKRADELAEVLGEDHDLTMLATIVADGGSSGRGGSLPILPKGSRRALMRELRRRRRRLRRRALKLGRELYGRPPPRFAGRLRDGYAPPPPRRAFC